MSSGDALLLELLPDINALGEPLFGASEWLLSHNDGFLPHGGGLTAEGEVRLAMAEAETTNELVSAPEVLPLLHKGLRQSARSVPYKAVAVAEDVTIRRDGGETTKAIKVLVEHERGLSVALYLPYEKDSRRGYLFGDVITMLAEPEIRPWQ